MHTRVWVAVIVAALFSLVPIAGHAQELDPQATEQAYTTADPINSDRLGLATLDGRYAIRLEDNCDGITVDQNVLIWPGAQLPPWLTIAVDENSPRCLVTVEGRMDTHPCLQNADGACDVAEEHD
jgi:hypothetical protein